MMMGLIVLLEAENVAVLRSRSCELVLIGLQRARAVMPLGKVIPSHCWIELSPGASVGGEITASRCTRGCSGWMLGNI